MLVIVDLVVVIYIFVALFILVEEIGVDRVQYEYRIQ